MAKRGPAPKGNRDQATFRAPADHLSEYRRLAQKEGIPLGDYIAQQLALAHGLDEPAYIRRVDHHPKLPIGA